MIKNDKNNNKETVVLKKKTKKSRIHENSARIISCITKDRTFWQNIKIKGNRLQQYRVLKSHIFQKSMTHQ